jgi:hypothetical protein
VLLPDSPDPAWAWRQRDLFILLARWSAVECRLPRIAAAKDQADTETGDPPSKRILHSRLNFFESSSSPLSIALLLSFVPTTAPVGSLASAAPRPSPSPALGGVALPLGAGAASRGWADEAGAVGLDSGRFASAGAGEDMHPPMVRMQEMGREEEVESVMRSRGTR